MEKETDPGKEEGMEIKDGTRPGHWQHLCTLLTGSQGSATKCHTGPITIHFHVYSKIVVAFV